jgi:DNA invertase Pin-like site-specific DNA recombinase
VVGGPIRRRAVRSRACEGPPPSSRAGLGELRALEGVGGSGYGEGRALRAGIHERQGQNKETQLRPLREHLGGLGKAQFVGEFIDTASADDLRGRRNWRRLLELVRLRRVDVIIVWRLDRAFRSVVDGATTLEALRSCGCGIRSLQEPWIDTTTAFGEALYHITIVWAMLEKATMRERIKAGMERARAEGKQVGRRPRTQLLSEHPQWAKVVQGLELGHLTRAEAARKLRVRRSTLVAALRALPSGAPASLPPDEIRSES